MPRASAADLLTDAIRIDPGLHGPLVARFADPAVMTAWGVSAASVLARAFDGIAAHAPGPATELAVAVWAFTEERDETTYPSPSQLAEFTGNRQADLEAHATTSARHSRPSSPATLRPPSRCTSASSKPQCPRQRTSLSRPCSPLAAARSPARVMGRCSR